MPRAALTLRERLERYMPDEVLKEAVLPVLGRAWVGLEREHLFLDERREQRIELILTKTRDRRRCPTRERLADDGRVLKQATLLGRQPVEACGDQPVQRLGNLERPDLAGDDVRRATFGEQPAIEQHAHRLDGVERHSLGARQDLVAQLRRQSRNKAREQLRHRALRERLEI